MRAFIEHLAAFNTRNTNTPELEQAADWIAGRFREIPGLQVELFHYDIHAGPRVPKDKTVVEVVATLPGANDRRVIIGGHFDSINMTRGADLYTARAPGANDDLSGVALTLEAARLMSTQKWDDTLVFVAFSGEEQGLFGSAALAKHARGEGWKIDGVLSNDMVGNSSDNVGQRDDREVRVFSEESPEHQSREMARYAEWLQDSRREALFFDPDLVRRRNSHPGHGIMLVFRKDRFGRGGDHSSFNDQGYTAIRFVDVYEEYSRQHTPNDLPQFVDYRYLTNNVLANILVASALANAPAPPARVRIVRDQSHSTTVSWQGPPSQKCVVYWRDTTSPVWQDSRVVRGNRVTIDKVDKDDHVFAVGSVGGIPVPAT